MSQPIPGQISADSYLEKVVPFAKRLRALGIDPNDSKDVINSMQKSYREMDSEAYADNFATDYIMRHYNDFFEDSDSTTNSPEKVKTHVGEIMKINANLNMLGLTEGKSTKMTRVEPIKLDGKIQDFSVPASARANEGFLSRKIRIGDGVELLKEGDPTSKERYSKSPAVKNVYIRPQKDHNGKIHNEIVAELDGDRYFMVELTGQEPSRIEVTPEEMMNRLNLKTDSKVILMKRELSSDSAVRLGSILGGRIEKPDYFYGDSPIQEDHGIHLTSTAGEETGVDDLVDPDFMCGGNTSAIDKIYRKWKSYFIETTTSTYEVIPYR